MALERSRPFGELLRDSRRAAGLTQEELAARAGLSARTLRKLENGESLTPRKDTLLLLADALGLSPEQHARFLSAARQARAGQQAGGNPPTPVLGAGVAESQAPTLAIAAPIAPPTPTARHNLPAHLTPLLGREHEEAAAVHLLRREDVRLLTLTGAPGIGKTRLALQVAADMLDAAPDGIFLIELAPITDPALVLASIMRSLEVRETSGAAGSPLAALRTHLGARRMLLLLDNVEQVVAAGPQVVELLNACPGLRMLVTSRIPLHVRGEHLLAVPPLAVPDLAAVPTAEELMRYAGIALFVQRAREVKPKFALTGAQAPAVAAICQRLDGLPLAIELAAAWVRLLSPVALRARLEQRHALLTAGARDLPERQQTLRTAIEWSYDLLASVEQALLWRLAIFVGGWTLEAAEVVCGDVGGSEEILPALATLVDTSLVDQQEEAASGDVRFRLLELVREYALERLAASGEAEAVAQRQARYYIGLGERAGGSLAGPEGEAWMIRLTREHENLRAALDWAKRHDVAAGLHLAMDLLDYWSMHGQVSEGRTWLEKFLDLDARAGMQAGFLVRGFAVNAAGILAFRQDDFAHAVRHHEEALSLARQNRQKRLTANALNMLGNIARERGDAMRAWMCYEEALAVRQEMGHQLEAAVVAEAAGSLTSGDLETLWREQGNAGANTYADSATVPGAMLAGLVRSNKHNIAALLGGLGKVALTQQDYARASNMIVQAGVVFAELGLAFAEAWTRAERAEIAIRQGDYTQARTLLESALPVFRDSGHMEGYAFVLRWLGRVAHGQGDPAAAMTLYRHSLALAKDMGTRLDIARGLEGMAMARAATGECEAAVRLLAAAEVVREAIHVPLTPADREGMDRVAAELCTALGAERFSVHWAAARATPLERLLEQILAEVER
jgi:predicted ATPase/transcriptional regulator with XRE-family HTH domain